MGRPFGVAMVAFAGILAGACGGGSDMMGSGMNGRGGMATSATLMSVSPAGGATGVPVATSVTIRFGGAMAGGMEQYVDLHVGDLSGPVVAMGCAWSADRTVLTCTPAAPLAPQTTYAIHVGGGMTGASGAAVDYTTYGPGMGGQWLMGSMMTSTHGGMAWGMMGNGWRHANGSYGMVFAFTTA